MTVNLNSLARAIARDKDQVRAPQDEAALAAETAAPTAGVEFGLPAELSARHTLDRRQARAVLVGLASLLVAGVIAPLATAIAVNAVITFVFAAAFIYRAAALWAGFRDPDVIDVTDEEARAVPDDELPLYTVLIAAYREAGVIGALIDRIAALEYPSDRLDVKLLLEEDDDETYEAATAATLPPSMAIVRVPQSTPKTKPKACNVGLRRARGEFLTLYDAEDRPDPLQLRRAVVAFRRLDPSVACLQAKLSYHNAEQNLLTKWFTVEYAMWFSRLLPGLVARRGPLPLGGTSNHFRRDVLEALGGWDAFNVTEDADLGIRLHRRGYRTRVLESITFEEANSDVVNWIKQRSRWYKGYLQTWLVHMRTPVLLWRELGTRGFIGFNLFVAGTPLLAILSPAFWLLTVAWFLGRPDIVVALFPTWLYYIGLALMVGGNAVLLYSWLVSARLTGLPSLVYAGLLVPAYFVLMSLAAVKACVQLIQAPSFWEKTVHGLDSPTDEATAETAS